MNQVNIEMTLISRCEASACSYNKNNGCHAKAITIGDVKYPMCDTYLHTSGHCKETERSAGVGACKVIGCQHNSDFECSAQSINVGLSGKDIMCLTFKQAS